MAPFFLSPSLLSFFPLFFSLGRSPQATRELGSCMRQASSTASETWSQILSVGRGRGGAKRRQWGDEKLQVGFPSFCRPSLFFSFSSLSFSLPHTYTHTPHINKHTHTHYLSRASPCVGRDSKCDRCRSAVTDAPGWPSPTDSEVKRKRSAIVLL